MDIVKKLIVGLGLGCLLSGTVIALMGLYMRGLELTIIGFVFIAVGIIIMELLHRKNTQFERTGNSTEQDMQSPASEISRFTKK